MKKIILPILAILIISGSPLSAQVGRLLNKVTKAVVSPTASKPASSAAVNQEPEPACACDQAELILDLGGKLKLMYSEISMSIRDDGAILVKDKTSDNYYIVKDGNPEGPIKAGDSRLSGFESIDNSDNSSSSSKQKTWPNNPYISSSGDKFTIRFAGKTYGPYSQISEFKVAKTKDKFAAIVIENVPVSEADGKKMDAAIKNAKTEQEKMELSMKYSQMMMQKMQEGGGAQGMMPKLVTNIAGATYDPLKSTGGTLNNNVKFDDILFITYDKVIDLSNKVLMTLKPDAQGAEALFVNSANTKYVYYKYGTLTFSDGTTMSDLFNLHLLKTGTQVYLAYMYFSPKRNAIMQCKMPF